MPLFLPKLNQRISVILRQDSAIDVPDEVYERYLENLDESILTFVEGLEPVRFVLKKVLSSDEASEVMSKQAKMRGKETQLNLGYIIEEVRLSLVDVLNPPNASADELIIFEKDKDGGASKDLIAQIHAIGGVMDLWTALKSSTKNMNVDNLKKK